MISPKAFTGVCFISFLASSVICRDVDTPRYLVFPPESNFAPTKVQLILGLGVPMEVDVSTIIGYVVKCNYNLPYNASYLTEPYVNFQRSKTTEEDSTIDKRGSNEADESQTIVIGRYEIYKMLESAINTAFQPGKACLLRAICEAAATPLNTNDGLFAQLLHIFLTPSSTTEPYKDPTDQEYLAAESIGFRQGDNCAHAFRDCSSSFLDYFSKIHL